MDKKDVERLAAMIKLDLSEAEISEYTKQLDAILGYLDKLQGVPPQAINYADWPSTQGQSDEAINSDGDLRRALTGQFSKETLEHLEVPAVFSENKEFKSKQE
ncbi:MAG TPA: Asp-tRNA(Asn)/Glu-tRNA(Gln) amidotransferase subunit GatC [bacterium]|nr:Asp-tRNA(Asn)/Glu-tRNA(Gln) amidotransferase subunit GatC [bacterium]